MSLKDFHPLPYSLYIRCAEWAGYLRLLLVAERRSIRRTIAHIYRQHDEYVLSVVLNEDFYSYDLYGSAEQVAESLAALLEDERLDEYLMEEVFYRAP